MAKAKFFCAAVVMAFMAVIPASAQGVAFGVKGGVNFTKMSIDNDAVKSESDVELMGDRYYLFLLKH